MIASSYLIYAMILQKMFATVCCSKFVNKFKCSKLTSEFLEGFDIGGEIHL